MGGHGRGAAAWAPADGLERLFWTTLFNILYATGIGLLLAGAFALRRRVSWRTGLGWGGLGLLAFTVAPAIGLEPTLPGMATADLAARQSWWLLTALVTASGLAPLVASRRARAIAAAIGLILSPHLIGAPNRCSDALDLWPAGPGRTAPPVPVVGAVQLRGVLAHGRLSQRPRGKPTEAVARTES